MLPPEAVAKPKKWNPVLGIVAVASACVMLFISSIQYVEPDVSFIPKNLRPSRAFLMLGSLAQETTVYQWKTDYPKVKELAAGELERKGFMPMTTNTPLHHFFIREGESFGIEPYYTGIYTQSSKPVGIRVTFTHREKSEFRIRMKNFMEHVRRLKFWK